ncbi:SHD1 domain-containing protein [bacterium]|nr:SHD1 domain-containing protein [bacterium]
MKFSIVILVALVLFLSEQASAQKRFLNTPPGAPTYTIDNVRRGEATYGEKGISFDFRRTRKGFENPINVYVKLPEGNFNLYALIPTSEESGTREFSKLMSIRDIEDCEIVLTQNYETPDLNQHYYIVSNVLRVGNPGKNIRGEAWNAEEKKALAEYNRIINDDSAHKFFQRFRITVQPTEGFELLSNNAIVTKTTPLKLCKSKKWRTVQTLSQNDDGTVNVTWKTGRIKLAFSVARTDLIIKSETLKSLRRDPNIKFVSAKVDPSLPKPTLDLKKYKIFIPVESGWATIPDNVDVPKGTPLKRCYRKKWSPLTCLGCNEDGTISVREDEFPNSDGYKMLRKELIVPISVVGEDAAKRAAAEATRYDGLATPLRKKDYKVSIEVPADSQFVPKDAELEPGTAMQACYAGKWRPLTLISSANDGTLNVSWDEYSSGFDCSVQRRQLIVKNNVLNPAGNSQNPASDDAVAEFRTWINDTGKFKVKAKLLSRTESSVTLLTETEKEIILPITKLSEADQKLLKENKD